jgi:hypothetical protein
VSTPNSPARGTTWNVHSRRPLCASKPRTSSGAASFLLVPVSPAPAVLPVTTTTLPTTMGPVLSLKCPASGWFSWKRRLARPWSPNPGAGLPVSALSAYRYSPRMAKMRLSALPAPPRQ